MTVSMRRSGSNSGFTECGSANSDRDDGCLSGFAYFLWKRYDLGGRGGISFDEAHLVYGLGERLQPPIKLQIALARVEFFFLRSHLSIESECRESRFEALNLVPKIIRDLVRNGMLIRLRHVHDLCGNF